MEYRVLGPLEVLDVSGDKLRLGGAMQQSVLAALLLQVGKTVSLQHLVDELWEEPPPTAARTVQGYVSRLRRELPEGAIKSRPGGYALLLHGAELDLEMFERRAEEGRNALTADDFARAASLLREALDLWRGPALAGLTSNAMQIQAARLEESRLVVLEERIEAELGSGRHAELVPELQTLVAQQPFRDRLRGQLMRALYGSGRPGEALAVYQETRRLLKEELGIEPSPELGELQKRILRQDPELAVPKPRPSVARPEPFAQPLSEIATREVRKVVTVLFCDVVGSTAFGETTDPEVLRAHLARFFERMKAIVELHGGTVEKFVGDAVMAVFGVPGAHEDDALRGCRAALEMVKNFPELGVVGRIGINTGEVVAGTKERLVTGDAVNVASRLQAEAEPGEVLVGEPTLEFVREAAEVETLAPLALKGKTEPFTAHRLLAVHEVRPRHKGPFVGRKSELAAIHDAWRHARDEECGELFTIVGDAGIGKSRLVAEALRSIDSRVVQGRCLPYGDGITYWPVVETLKQLDTLPSNSHASAAISSVLGESKTVTSPDEIAWGYRELLKEQAPLVVVFDDIQWAEHTLLDLIESVAPYSHDAPLLLLCLARLDLIEQHRPTWPVSLRLTPLTHAEVEELLPATISGEQRKRVVQISGRNPLFVTELVAMGAEGEVAIPRNLDALLAARLDQLDPAEREVLQCGAVEGEVFHRRAVQALNPEEQQLTPRLTALVRKELIRPDHARLERDDAFRFRHLLVRDAAYRSLPKEMRADLHERFAGWLEHEAEERLVEFEEIVGYHLERAYRYRVELGSIDVDVDALARRASQRLESAGRRALGRSDLPAAIGLLDRAGTLLAVDDPERAPLLAELAAVLIEAGELERANSILDEVDQLPSDADERTASRFELQRQLRKLLQVEEQGPEEARSVVERVVPVFERAGDDRGLCDAWHIEALSYWNEARAASATDAWEKAAAHAQQAGDEHEYANILTWIASSFLFGPIPVGEGIERSEELLREVGGNLAAEAAVRGHLAGLQAKDCRFDEARKLLATSAAALAELGPSLNAATSHSEAVVEALAGDYAAAERSLRLGYEALDEMSEKAFRSTTAALLARTILAQGREEEAENLADTSADLVAPADVFTLVLLRGVQARIAAKKGAIDNAEALAREAVELAERSDFLDARGDAFVDLAWVLREARREEEACSCMSEALGLFAMKGNRAAEEIARAQLAEYSRL